MKLRILSLVLVLTIILVIPAVISSCTKVVAQTETVTQTTDATPSEANSATVTSDSGSSWLTTFFGSSDVWQNILVVILGVLSTIFATLWNRARNVISAIDEALLNDGKIDKAELQKIIQAWKK